MIMEMDMILEANLKKSGAFWLVEVPLLDALTQAKTRSGVKAMLKDLISSLANERGLSLHIVETSKPGTMLIECQKHDVLISLMLKRQRQKRGLSLREVSKRLGESSPNAYARYEQGLARPTVKKLMQLMKAVNPKMRLGLKVY